MPESAQVTASKELITCHVLNTVTGQPGRGLDVVLQCITHGYDHYSYKGITNDNGRVSSWNSQLDISPREVYEMCRATDAEQYTLTGLVWAMKFNVGRYFGDQGLEDPGWWDIIEIRFKTDVDGVIARDHWHVPLLLSPYSYTTYRGS